MAEVSGVCVYCDAARPGSFERWITCRITFTSRSKKFTSSIQIGSGISIPAMAWSDYVRWIAGSKEY